MKGDGFYYSQNRAEMIDLIDSSLENVTILDVGAGEGGFLNLVKKALNVRECWAIEPSDIYTKIKADCVYNLPVEEALSKLPDAYFDFIFFNDVIEHLVSPWDILHAVKQKLAPNGRIVISVPNFLFIDAVKHIMRGDFYYQEYGVLDKTHLRFFTYKSLLRLVNDCGYKVELIKGINGYYTW